MAFCKTKAVTLREPRKMNAIIAALKKKGFGIDGSAGWCTGGWARYIKATQVSNPACPSDTSSISAPGSRWLQFQWGLDSRENDVARVDYHVTGLVRDSRREQHEPDLCPRIKVLAHRQGPQGEHPEWMANYHSTRGYAPPPTDFEGDQLQTVIRYSGLVWHCRWDHAEFPFRGFWWDSLHEILFLPTPA